MELETLPNQAINSYSKRPLILVVDDNPDNLELLNQILMLLDYSFITAVDGVSTIELTQQHQPDLILLDMMLPDMSGLEVVMQLKQNPLTSAIPIIAVTAMARTEDQERALSVGCVEYIKKPYIVDELELIINRYL